MPNNHKVPVIFNLAVKFNYSFFNIGVYIYVLLSCKQGISFTLSLVISNTYDA